MGLGLPQFLPWRQSESARQDILDMQMGRTIARDTRAKKAQINQHYTLQEHTQEAHDKAVKKQLLRERRMERLGGIAGDDQNDGFIASFIKKIYNEDRGGFQLAGVGGGVIGLALGGLMGMQIAGTAGGGYLGTIATVVLAGAGLMFGSKLGNEYFPSKPTPHHPSYAKKSSSSAPSQTIAQNEEVQNEVSSVPEEALVVARNANISGGVDATTTKVAAHTTLLPPSNETRTI